MAGETWAMFDVGSRKQLSKSRRPKQCCTLRGGAIGAKVDRYYIQGASDCMAELDDKILLTQEWDVVGVGRVRYSRVRRRSGRKQ